MKVSLPLFCGISRVNQNDSDFCLSAEERSVAQAGCTTVF